MKPTHFNVDRKIQFINIPDINLGLTTVIPIKPTADAPNGWDYVIESLEFKNIPNIYLNFCYFSHELVKHKGLYIKRGKNRSKDKYKEEVIFETHTL